MLSSAETRVPTTVAKSRSWSGRNRRKEIQSQRTPAEMSTMNIRAFIGSGFFCISFGREASEQQSSCCWILGQARCVCLAAILAPASCTKHLPLHKPRQALVPRLLSRRRRLEERARTGGAVGSRVAGMRKVGPGEREPKARIEREES